MMSFKQRAAWLWKYWHPHRKFLILLSFLTILSTTVAIAYPLVFRYIIDQIATSAGFRAGFDLATVMLMLGAVAVARLVARFYPAFRAWMNINLQVGIREHIFASILEKDHAFFNTFRTGDLVTRLTDDIEDYPKLAWFGCSALFRALESASILVFCVAAMLWLDWRLALLSLLPLPVMGLYLYRVLGALRRAFQEQQLEISRTNNMLEATFSGIRIVKAFASEEGQSKQLDDILDHRIGVQLHVRTLLGLLHSLYMFVARSGQVLVLAMGGLMVLSGEVSLGTIYAFYVYLDMLVRPMFDLPNLLVSSRQAAVCMDREEEILTFPKTHRQGGDRSLERIEELALEQVRVGYDGKHTVLNGISMRIEAGRHVALVGPVASGKTTLLKTIAGLLQPREGRLLVNGRPIDQWRLDQYRSRIGYVPQESLLFSETIGENVVIGREDAQERLQEALQVAQLQDDLATMPAGVDTELGQKGTLISGGQKQRVAIARSIAGRPDIYLFDDCTANLDANTEDAFWTSLVRYHPEATLVTVSHRIATIKRADRILVLSEGRIIDQGTHQSLAERSPTYREFLRMAEYRGHLEEM